MVKERSVAAFRPLRYRTERVGELGAVWAPPYDVITTSDAAALRARHSHNIVRLTNPEGDEATRYREAARTLQAWVADGVLARDDEPTAILHRHHFALAGQAYERSGLWSLLRASPFDAGIVLPHERTMSRPKADRLALMQACQAQFSPIFVIASDPSGAFRQRLSELAKQAADARTEFPAGEQHEIWHLAGSGFEGLAAALEGQTFLIADGHHRYETFLTFRDELVRDGASATGKLTHEFSLAYIVSERDPGLLVLPTHRLIGGESRDWVGAVLRATERFDVVRLEDPDVETVADILIEEAGRPTFVIVAHDMSGGWLLRLRKPNRLQTVAAVAFHDVFLPEVLKLEPDEQHLRMTYIKDASEAVTSVRSGAKQAAALLAPPLVAQVREVALAGQRLPAKTTYFWPKVPTGIALHVINPEEAVGTPASE